jgi:Glycine zipper 2TM domain
MTIRTQSFPRVALAAVAISSLVVFLTGCAAEPPARPVRRVYREAPPVEKPNTDVYAYPMHDQPADQQERDRYECSMWATKQTGFDPSAPNVPPHDRVRVVSAGPPPGTGTAVGAVAGAILGAAVAGPRDSGAGAVVGAVTGAAVGTAADASRAREVHEVVTQDRRQAALFEQKAANYRRAIGACLDARGYSVR